MFHVVGGGVGPHRGAGADDACGQFVIDGQYAGMVNADQSRPDLQPFLGTADHGYYFALPTSLSDGLHSVDIYVQDYSTTNVKWLGTRQIEKRF